MSAIQKLSTQHSQKRIFPFISMTTAPYQLLKEFACIVNKPFLAIGLFSFSISSSICSKALLQKEIGCRCVLFFFTPSLFVSERGRSWRLKFSLLGHKELSGETEYLCVPVNQYLEPINSKLPWFPAIQVPSAIGS